MVITPPGRLAPQPPPCPAMATFNLSLLPPNPEEKDFIQAYEDVREKYKGEGRESGGHGQCWQAARGARCTAVLGRAGAPGVSALGASSGSQMENSPCLLGQGDGGWVFN
ncbi:UNVERIFIED_CONTAM: hypothetical protein K2H54_001105 [Gekko kuhli]